MVLDDLLDDEVEPLLGELGVEIDGVAVRDRPQDLAEFQTGNADLSRLLAAAATEAASAGRRPTLVYASSTQATLDNPYGRSKRDAEDVLQEAYLKAWRALPGFRGEARLSTWLVRIVANEAFGHAFEVGVFGGVGQGLDTVFHRVNERLLTHGEAHRQGIGISGHECITAIPVA